MYPRIYHGPRHHLPRDLGGFIITWILEGHQCDKIKASTARRSLPSQMSIHQWPIDGFQERRGSSCQPAPRTADETAKPATRLMHGAASRDIVGHTEAPLGTAVIRPRGVRTRTSER